MINPILATSARQRMRSLRTPLIVTLYSLLLLAAVYFFCFRGIGASTFTIGQMRQTLDGYIYLLLLQFLLLVLVSPAMTAGSISGERERQTLDLLRVTNINAMEIIIGKLLENFGFLCLLIISSLPMMGLLLLAGTVSLVQLMTSMLFLLLVALAASCVGLFASVLFRRTVTATVAAYLSVFALGALTLVPIFVDIDKLGDIITLARDVNQNQIQAAISQYTPISFVINPGLGLVSLLVDQTKLLQTTLGQFSYTFSQGFPYMPFGTYLTYNMIFLGSFSVLLVLLSAWRLHYRKADRPSFRREKK